MYYKVVDLASDFSFTYEGGKTGDGKRNGRGTMTYYDCGVWNGCYEGQWKDDQRSGKGTMVWARAKGNKADDKYTYTALSSYQGGQRRDRRGDGGAGRSR